MKGLARSVMAMLLTMPGVAPAGEIRALFVGIDRYLYSSTAVPGSRTVVPTAGFRDLRGAVSDTMTMREALRTIYRLDIDTPPTVRRIACKTENAVSITLTDTCATRAAILDGLRRLVARSKPGDTAIFYFAGHGSQFLDKIVGDQASGYSDTILPTDARKPGAQIDGDILDRELRVEIDAATDKGVNVVTIFDSCNSGTATRDPAAQGEARHAPVLRVAGIRPMTVQPRSGSGGGYRVHLAAAADGEEAREVGKPGARKAGVFTTALVDVLKIMPNARFADVATEVRLRVGTAGFVGQNPQAEGALNASLGGANDHRPTYSATHSGSGLTLLAGSLSGVTPGSTFALFHSSSEALAPGAVPLASATVAKVYTNSAGLALSIPAPASLPSRLIALETAHAFGGQKLLIRADAVNAADKAAVAAALRGLDFANLGEPAQLQLSSGASGLRLVGLDGIGDVELGPSQDAGFSGRLRAALQKVARVNALLDLARVRRLGAEAGEPLVAFCISSDLLYDPDQCPAAATSDGPLLALNKPAKLTVTNRSGSPLYVYVLAIDRNYAVNLLLPANHGVDSALRPGLSVQRSDTGPDDIGRLQFLTLSTDAPINAAALEQSGVGGRDPAGCVSALERALCAAAKGTRDPAVPRVGTWSAILSSTQVK